MRSFFGNFGTCHAGKIIFFLTKEEYVLVHLNIKATYFLINLRNSGFSKSTHLGRWPLLSNLMLCASFIDYGIRTTLHLFKLKMKWLE